MAVVVDCRGTAEAAVRMVAYQVAVGAAAAAETSKLKINDHCLSDSHKDSGFATSLDFACRLHPRHA